MTEVPATNPVPAENPRLAALAALPYAARGERAIWLQIYDRLADAIRAGIVAPGSRLPGEVHLAELFRVNRITMRRALALHQNEGRLNARKGVGIFVRHRPRRFELRSDRRFAEALATGGGTVSSRDISLDRGAPSPEAATLFGIGPGDMVIRLTRLRLLDGAPIYLSRKEFPAALFPAFETVYADSGSVTEVYRAAGFDTYRRAEIRIMGGLATADVATTLEISPKTPVQHVTSTNRAPDGRAIEFNRGCWPMASVELVIVPGD